VDLVCIALMISDVEHFVHATISPRMSSFEKYLFSSLFKWFIFLLLGCLSSLYSLDISPFSDMWFENIFFHPVGGTFILLTVSFVMQEHFSLV
jgi:membrane-associated PAP2 superfamily phosphatase